MANEQQKYKYLYQDNMAGLPASVPLCPAGVQVHGASWGQLVRVSLFGISFPMDLSHNSSQFRFGLFLAGVVA